MKEQFEKINLAALPDNLKEELKDIKENTDNFSDPELVEIEQENFDRAMRIIKKEYPEALKPSRQLRIKKEKPKPKKRLVIKKTGSSYRAADGKDEDCDEAINELNKIRLKRKKAASKRADAPKKQHQTLASERQVKAFKHAIRTSDLKGDHERAQEFAKDLAKVYRKYGMESVADKILEAAKPKAEQGAQISDVARPAAFMIDAIPGKTFAGYTFGEEWNGWAVPYFEHAEAKRIVEASEPGSKFMEDSAIIFVNGEEEEYEAETINTTDGPQKVYPIGSKAWIWRETGAWEVEHDGETTRYDDEGLIDFADTVAGYDYEDEEQAISTVEQAKKFLEANNYKVTSLDYL